MKAARVFAFLSAYILLVGSIVASDVYIRVNQAGYVPADRKVAIIFSRAPITGDFELKNAGSESIALRASVTKAGAPASWGGQFPHYLELDFSEVRTAGRFYL